MYQLIQNPLNSCRRFSLLVLALTVTAACNKAGESSAPPAKPAKEVVETVENDLHTLTLLYECKMTVEEKQLGTELKDYTVSILCPEPDSLANLDKRAAEMQKIRTYIGDHRSTMIHSTLSQKNLLFQYDRELEKNTKALQKTREQIMASENDAAYKKELALLKASGCQLQTANGLFKVVCEDRPTLEELETQVKELKAVMALLQTQHQRMRLAEKFKSIISAYDSALWENSQRINKANDAMVVSLSAIAADLKARFQIDLQAYDVRIFDWTTDFSKPERFYKSESLAKMARDLKDLLASSEATTYLGERDIKTLRLMHSDLRCESDEAKSIVTWCSNWVLRERLKLVPSKSDRAELTALTEKLLASPSLRTRQASVPKFQCDKSVPVLQCLRVARLVDQAIAKNPSPKEWLAIQITDDRYSSYSWTKWGEGTDSDKKFYLLELSTSQADSALQSFLAENFK